MTHQIGAGRFGVLPVVVDHFVSTFTAVVGELTISATGQQTPTGVITDPAERIFHVPDMSCAHCLTTISGVLRSLGIEVLEADLAEKRFVADFGTRDARERAFDAIRGSGYTVMPPRAV
jgi:copper chaperone CopZ